MCKSFFFDHQDVSIFDLSFLNINAGVNCFDLEKKNPLQTEPARFNIMASFGSYNNLLIMHTFLD